MSKDLRGMEPYGYLGEEHCRQRTKSLRPVQDVMGSCPATMVRQLFIHVPSSSSVLCQGTLLVSRLAVLGHGPLMVYQWGQERKARRWQPVQGCPFPWCLGDAGTAIRLSPIIPDSLFSSVYSP